MSRALIIGAAALVVVVLLAVSSLFTVDQTEQVLITQFGRPVRVISDPGLHAKVPFIQTVISFDRRLLNLELSGEEVILGDQRRLIVDSFTMFRITDPLRYYQAVGPAEDGIRGRLNSIVSSSLRRVLGNNTLLDVLSADRTHIMANIREQVNSEMGSFGVAIEDVRIRRADLPEENTQAILSRMQSERQRVAAQARAEGVEASPAHPCRRRTRPHRAAGRGACQSRQSARRGRGDGQPHLLPRPMARIPASLPPGARCRPITMRSPAGTPSWF